MRVVPVTGVSALGGEDPAALFADKVTVCLYDMVVQGNGRRKCYVALSTAKTYGGFVNNALIKSLK